MRLVCLFNERSLHQQNAIIYSVLSSSQSHSLPPEATTVKTGAVDFFVLREGWSLLLRKLSYRPSLNYDATYR